MRSARTRRYTTLLSAMSSAMAGSDTARTMRVRIERRSPRRIGRGVGTGAVTQSHLFHAQHVADTADRLDEGAVLVELLAQRRDVHLDRVRLRAHVALPRGLDELILREHAVLSSDERLEELKLFL